jgi:hypothetical protein
MSNRNLTTQVETVDSVSQANFLNAIGSDSYIFPQDVSPEFCFGLMTKKFKHASSGTRSTEVGSHYILPLPASIQDQQGIRYSTPEPGAVMAGLANVGMGLAGAMMDASGPGEAGKVLGYTLKGLADQVRGGVRKMDAGDAIGGLQLAAQAAGAGDSYLAGAAGAMMGQVPNPNITAFFQGVELRNHSFQWDMYPQSELESVNLHNMIRSLRRDALPGRAAPVKIGIPVGDGTGSLGLSQVEVNPFLTYPLEAHITITTMGAQNTIRFKPAFIESISVNYAPGGVAFLKNGQPAGVQLGLSFKEVDIHTREDYAGQNVLTEGNKQFQSAIKEMGGFSG